MDDVALAQFNSVCPDYSFVVGDTKERLLALARGIGLDPAQLEAVEQTLGWVGM